MQIPIHGLSRDTNMILWGRGNLVESTDLYYTDGSVGTGGNITNYTFDVLNRKRKEELPDPDGVEDLSRPTTEYVL